MDKEIKLLDKLQQLDKQEYLDDIVNLKLLNEFHLLTNNEMNRLIDFETIIDYLRQNYHTKQIYKDWYHKAISLDDEIEMLKSLNKMQNIPERLSEKYNIQNIKTIINKYNNDGITEEESIVLEGFSLPLYNNNDTYHRQFYEEYINTIDDFDDIINEFGYIKYKKILDIKAKIDGEEVFWETSIIAFEYVDEYDIPNISSNIKKLKIK